MPDQQVAVRESALKSNGRFCAKALGHAEPTTVMESTGHQQQEQMKPVAMCGTRLGGAGRNGGPLHWADRGR